jgi:outer membrane protein assembly factor BamA
VKITRINIHSIKIILLVIVTFNCAIITAQHKSDSTKKLKYLIIPTLFKTPEVGIAYGVSGSFAFKTTNFKDSLTRTSIIQGIGFLTTHHQNVQAIDASIYFPKENYILLGQLAHSYFPDKFWGIGPNTSDKPWEHYTYEQYYISPHLKKKIMHRLWIGALYEFQSVYNISYIDGGLYDSAHFSGKKPYNVSGTGLSISYDTRNSTFWPTKGLYILSQFTDFRKELFSDYNVVKWITDVRYFKKIYNENHVLGFQFLNYETFGQTPLRELAAFGGPNNMRGFYQGRYRANNMISLMSEYRLHLIGRFSSVFFGGLGDVYNHYDELSINNIKYSCGAGLRFSILAKERLNIRVDYGYSSRFNKGLYITFGECF